MKKYELTHSELKELWDVAFFNGQKYSNDRLKINSDTSDKPWLYTLDLKLEHIFLKRDKC